MTDRPAFRAKFIYEAAEGLTLKEFFSATELVAGMALHGFDLIGQTTNPALRPELQGQPKFKGLAGPMWDDGALRYESPRAYAAFSI